MTSRSIGLMGAILVAALAVSAPAWAFSDNSDSGSSSSSSRDDDDDRAPSADYRYSGNSFNFSMSRNLAQPNGASATQDPNADQTQQQPRPGFFRRTMRSIFGD